ncbi:MULTISPECIES: co-chaperone YbbN [unclassified Azospirillum]|uniref:thioredoxin family protein n=1 Tax=unclassified Azospirillum TaxID=2630922 RepID=UPI000B6855DE|nr:MULTISPECIES: thioredoxin family protein [unclassified Azospirillum]SNS67626.1 thioredoxin [Azospirillum sp. RU38E]SNS85872.1 thioredoxin [Azospirillum sp. RU37A]
MSAEVISVSDNTYTVEIAQSEQPVLIDFWAPWCGPCMALLPTIEALAAVYDGEIKVVKVNADECPQLADKFGVQGIPHLVLVKDDKAITLRERTRTRLVSEIDGALARIMHPGA